MNPASIEIHGERFVPYISEQDIQHRIAEIAAALDARFDGTRPVGLCVLNGAFIFFSDVMRALSLDCDIDFLKISSYGKNKTSSNDVVMKLEPSLNLEGRDIILVEDIVDSGYSIAYLRAYLLSKHIASLTVVTLLHKPECTVVPNEMDYVGFSIPPYFVVGYGLDYDQHARHLSSIYIQEGALAESDPA